MMTVMIRVFHLCTSQENVLASSPLYIATAVSMELTCPEGSDYIPMCSETFPVCVPSERLCNRIADCDEAADEVQSLCGNCRLNIH